MTEAWTAADPYPETALAAVQPPAAAARACPYCGDRGVVLATPPTSTSGVLLPCGCMYWACWDRVVMR